MAAVAVRLDFDNSYKIEFLSEDLREGLFRTELQNDSVLPLKIEISREPHELLPGVFNLAFGPLDDEGKIDDKAQLHHKDYSKVFSSILSVALRISRFGKYQYENPFDFGDIHPSFDRIRKNMVIRSHLMYNYFVFKRNS